jgi:cytochrome c oxidase subunit 4
MTQHKVTPTTYVIVFVALILLTGATVGLSYVDLGVFHTFVGLAIASAKAVLIVLFFMHVLYSSRLTWLVALSGLAWLTILLGLTLTDYLSRSWQF